MPAYNYKADVNDLGATIHYKTVGKNGSHISETIQTNNNGDLYVSSDLRNEEHHYTDSVKTTHGEYISSCDKNFSVAVPNGRNESVAGSRIEIDGNLSYIVSKGPFLAEKEKQKIVAARSQPETQPDPLSLQPLTDLLNPSPNILKRAAAGWVTSDEAEKCADVSMPMAPTTALELIDTYIQQYDSLFSLCSSKGSQEIAKIYANDVQEKTNAMIEEKKKIINNIKNPYQKEKKSSELLAATQNIREVLSSPSTESAARIQNFDEKEYQKMAGEAAENMIEAERLC